MCVVSSDKKNFEFIIKDLSKNVILSFYCQSITIVCRLLEDFDFERASVSIIRCSDNMQLDVDLILSIWRNDNER